MKSLIFIFLVFFLQASSICADIVIEPADFSRGVGRLKQRLDLKQFHYHTANVDVSDEQIVFNSILPLKTKNSPQDGFTHQRQDDFFMLKTSFYRKAQSLVKGVWMSQGPSRDEKAQLKFVLQGKGREFQSFVDYSLGFPLAVFDRQEDMFMYSQLNTDTGEVLTKEWIYARSPNESSGSVYHWRIYSEEFYRKLVFVPQANGELHIERQVLVSNVDVNDYAKQRHLIDVVNKVGKGQWRISGEDTLASVGKVMYITKEGQRKEAFMRVNGVDELEIQINEPAQNYPILIEAQ